MSVVEAFWSCSSESWKKDINVMVLKVCRPDKFILRESPSTYMSQEALDFLHFERKLNEYMEKHDVHTVHPSLPEIGCFVLATVPEKKGWFRGRVTEILSTGKGYRISIYLIDYGRMELLERTRIRLKEEALRHVFEEAIKIPPQAFEFTLTALQPLTEALDEGASLCSVPSARWDTAAIEHVKSLVKSSGITMITIHGFTENEDLTGELHVLGTNGSPVCLNHELLSKKFGYLNQEDYLHENGFLRGTRFSFSNACEIASRYYDRNLCHAKSSSVDRDLQLEVFRELGFMNSKLSKLQAVLPQKPEKTGIGRGIIKTFSSENRKFLPHPVYIKQLSRCSSREGVSSECHSSDDTEIPDLESGRTSEMSTFSSRENSSQGAKLLQRMKQMQASSTSSSKENKSLSSRTSTRTATPNCPSHSPNRDVLLSQEKVLPVSSQSTLAAQLLERLKNKSLPTPEEPRCFQNTTVNNDLKFSQCSAISSLQTLNLDQPPPLKPLLDCDYNTNKFCSESDRFLQFRTTVLSREGSTNDENLEKQEDLDYSNFMKGYLSDEEEEAFDWRDQQSKGVCVNRNSLMENFGLINTDFDFTGIPADLEHYTTFRSEVSFRTEFDSSSWTSRIDYRFIRALAHGIPSAPKPCVNLDEAPFPFLLEHLKSLKFRGPSCIQSVMWPSVARSRNVVAVAPPHSGKTFGYLLPLLSSLLDMLKNRQTKHYLPVSSGPIVLILCSTWKGAQRVYDQIKRVLPNQHAVSVGILYAGGSERDQEVQLCNGVEILVSTPQSFLRVLKNYKYLVTNLKRCCNLILDDADRLVEEATDEIKEVLDELTKVFEQKVNKLTPQLIVCSEQWTPGINSFTKNLMDAPVILFSSFFEAAVYAKVPTKVHVLEECRKKETLLSILGGTKQRRTVLCTSSIKTCKELEELLIKSCIYCLVAHEHKTMMELENISLEWNSYHDENSYPVLLTTDAVLACLNVKNAFCLLNYDIPQGSKFEFGFRYSTLSDNMNTFYLQVPPDDEKRSVISHILLTEMNRQQAPEIMRLLERLKCEVPQSLLDLARREKLAHMLRNDTFLCPNLKAFGKCSLQGRCKSRHQIIPKFDKPNELPASGQVKVLVIRIIDASHYYVWLVEHYDPETKRKTVFTDVQDMKDKLISFYDSHGMEHGFVQNPQIGETFGLLVEDVQYHRVKVNGFEMSQEAHIRRAEVFHVDHGYTTKVAVSHLLPLPGDLQVVPPLAVEAYCCRIQPLDKDTDWSFQASSSVHFLITNKEMQGKIVLCLGRTLWFDPFVTMTKLESMGVYVKDIGIRSNLIQNSLALDNPHHVTRLRNLCLGKINLPSLKKGPVEDTPVEKHPIHYAFLDIGEFEDVYISSVISPDLFYVQRYKFITCLEELEDQINEFVSSKKAERSKTITKGMVCLGPFDNNRWYRTVVDDIDEDNGVTLFFPDFGDKHKVMSHNIYKIPPEFMILPFQAIECSLAGVNPLHGGWSEVACSSFSDFAFDENDINIVLVAKALSKTIGTHSEAPHYSVLMFDTNGSEDKILNAELVKQGLAAMAEVPGLREEYDSHENESSKQECELENIKCSGQVDPEDLDIESNFSLFLAKKYFGEELVDSVLKEKGNFKKISAAEENLPVKCNQSTQLAVREALSSTAKSVREILPMLRPVPGISNSLKPYMLWWQDDLFVTITILLAGIQSYDLKVTTDSFRFRAVINSDLYETEEELYGQVYPEDIVCKYTGLNLLIKMRKFPPKTSWEGLLKNAKKVKYIRYDLDHYEDEDDKVPVTESRVTAKKDFSDVLPYDPDDLDLGDGHDTNIKYVPDHEIFVEKDRYSVFD